MDTFGLPERQNPVSRAKNCHISGTTQPVFKIIFFPDKYCRVYGMNFSVGFRLRAERELKKGKTGKALLEPRFWTDFSEMFRKIGFQSPLTREKNFRKIEPETQGKKNN